MNKKLLGLGAMAVAGFLTLTAFEAKTLEQQRAEINAAVETRLSELRMQKDQECMLRVQDEARRRYDQWMMENAANQANAPRSGGRGVTRARGPKVDPVPQSKPSVPASQGKWNQGDQQQSKEKWQSGDPQQKSTTPAGGTQDSKKKWQKGTTGGGGGR
jgi:hypothetical protein